MVFNRLSPPSDLDHLVVDPKHHMVLHFACQTLLEELR